MCLFILKIIKSVSYEMRIVLKTNKKIFKQQQQLVNRYQLLSEKQEKLNKIK